MRAFKAFRGFSIAVLAAGSLLAFAQQPQARLSGPLNDNPRVLLLHSRTPRVQNAQDLGPLGQDVPIRGVTLVFRRSASQEAALQQLLKQQQTAGQPEYHQWLTPETFAARFGVAGADINATVNWLTAHGLHVDNVARSRDRITFSGSAAALQSAFGTQLHRYLVEGQPHFAPASDLSMPAALGAMTAAVLHLSDFRPGPSWKVSGNASPAYTDSVTGANYLLPSDVATLYDFTPVGASGPAGPAPITGITQIAVAGQSYVNTGSNSAISQFADWTQTNEGTQVIPILVPGSGVEAVSFGDLGESEVDLEWVNLTRAATSPFLVFVGDQQNYSVFDAMAYSISENIAPVVSVSYSECEALVSSTDLDQSNALFEQAAAQGQTVIVSSGDSGSTACEQEPASAPLTAAQRQSLSVNYPASSPYVTAVGGTQMAPGTFNAGNTTYWQQNGVGFSYIGSLLSYVPEVVWNEGSAGNGVLSGGGGSSSYFARPSWQTALPGIPAGAYRLLPDIALQSSIASPGFLLCTSDPTLLAAEGQTAGCTEGLLGSNGKLTIAGGTSFAAPIFAGMVSLLNVEQNAAGQGNINPALYSLAANPTTYASAFHDIVTGSNACVTAAEQCTPVGQGGYAAQAGFDEATGLGSIDFNALLGALPAGNTPGLLATAITVAPSDALASSGSFSLGINVEALPAGSSGAAPSGTVTVSIDGVAAGPALTLTASAAQGTASFNGTAPQADGYHLARLVYSGDATHSPSSTTYPFVVGSVAPSGGVSLSASNLTIPANGSGTTQVIATPSGGYGGELLWSLSITGGAGANLSGCYAIEPLVVNGVSSATLSLAVGTACDAPSASQRFRFGGASRHAGPRGLSSKTAPGFPAGASYAALLLCGCLFGGMRRGPRGSQLLAFLVLSAAMVGATVGCGGGAKQTSSSSTGSTGSGTTSSSGGTTSSGTNYNVTLVGTDSVNGSITSSANFTLTVD